MTVAARGWGLRTSDLRGGADGSRERKTLQTLCKNAINRLGTRAAAKNHFKAYYCCHDDHGE